VPKYQSLLLKIDYDEPKPQTYRGVQLVTREGEIVHTENSGNPPKDLYEAMKIRRQVAASAITDRSVDNFFVDAEQPEKDRYNLNREW
jgi:hypothetical protein